MISARFFGLVLLVAAIVIVRQALGVAGGLGLSAGLHALEAGGLFVLAVSTASLAAFFLLWPEAKQ